MAAIKRILHISPLPVWTLGNGSGMPSIERMLRYFDNQGIEQLYVHVTDSESELMKGDLRNLSFRTIKIPSFFSIFHRQLPYFVSNKKNIAYYSLFLPGRIKNIIESFSPDCVYSHLSQMAMPVFNASRRRCPMFVRLYGSMDQYYYVSGKTRFYKNSENLIQFRMPVCGYIMVNDGTGSDRIALQMGVRKNRILHMHNGCDEIMDTSNTDLRKKFGIGNVPIGLFVSRFTHSKGIDKLIDILTAMKDFPVHWILIGDGDLKESAESTLKSGQVNNVTFTGSVPHAELAGYLTESDFFISLNQYSVLCNPVLEALRAHLPVFALKRGIGTEFIDKILFLSVNPKGIVRNIKQNLAWLRRENQAYMKFTDSISNWEKEHLYTWEYRYEKELEFIETRVKSCGRT